MTVSLSKTQFSPSFPAEAEEKQKEIVNNTIPEGRDSGDLPVFTPCPSTRLHGSCLCCCLAPAPLVYAGLPVVFAVKYVGGYHGLLSGVTVRPGSVEPHSVVECLYACREGLDFGDLETLGSGMKVTPRSGVRGTH